MDNTDAVDYSYASASITLLARFATQEVRHPGITFVERAAFRLSCHHAAIGAIPSEKEQLSLQCEGEYLCKVRNESPRARGMLSRQQF